MQIINHRNSRLTLTQKFFIEKSLEMLHLGSIDSYRVRLHNSKTLFEELLYCLKEFKSRRIKHFHTIKTKDKEQYSLIDECLASLQGHPNYLTFEAISQPYLETILRNISDTNYLNVISALEILIRENNSYLHAVVNGLENLIVCGDSAIEALEKIDITLNALFSDLINKGYSKGYLYKIVYGIFVYTLSEGKDFANHFEAFKSKIMQVDSRFNVVFRVDTTPKVHEALSAISSDNLLLRDDIDDIKLNSKRPDDRRQEEFNNFNVRAGSRKFFQCFVSSKDYLAALKKAKSTLSEYLDVVNLGLSDESFHIHNRVLVIDTENPGKGGFQNNINILDGKYKVNKVHYQDFTRKLPAILTNKNIQVEAKDKIKSGIRYLRLGNQSTEVEHKFINYWIGLEYLFSNYESENTINRIKKHFINAHSRAYVKRNCYALMKVINQLSSEDKKKISPFPIELKNFLELDFYQETIIQLKDKYPLLAYRAEKLKNWFQSNDKPLNATKYIKKHRDNLESHFTRIYRVRNEIIHDAATNTNNEHITSNLRYYLTFILNEIIDFLHRNGSNKTSIEDYFIWNEIEVGNIAFLGNKLEDIFCVECSLDFIS